MEMLSQAVQRGVHRIIATPHYNDYVTDDFFDMRDQHCVELNRAAAEAGYEIEIVATAEIAFLSDWDRILAESRLRIYGHHLLIEFPEQNLPHDYLDTIFRVQRASLNPIIAHPERSIDIQQDLTIVTELARMGAHFQLDAGALIGQFGETAKKTAETLLKMNAYQFAGSDAHHQSNRNYEVLDAIDLRRFENDALTGEDLPDLQVGEIPKQNFLTRMKHLIKGN